ncbi:MAG: type II secretion system F family protein [Gammaproteobacteria bacterium]|nr:type II secretion system F family protein [Gammaproteobacteria bacterium]
MAVFQYKGRNQAGELVEGQQEADSSEALAGQLSAASITPVAIDELKITEDFSETLKKLLGIGKPNADDLILFTRQMYALAKSGVPIIKGLVLIANSTRNKIFAQTLRQIIDDLESGQTVSGALSHHTGIFSPLYINLIRVGEETGNLEGVFLRLYEYLDTDKVTLEQIKSALFYPSVVLTAIVAAIIFLMAKVIPVFAQAFDKFRLELPIQTRIIIAMSDFFADYWWLLLGLTIAAIVGLRHYVKTEAGRFKWHRFKLRLPRIGDILLRATLARFSRAFAMSNTSGVPILQGLTITAKAVDNDYMEAKINKMRNDVERGETVTRSARNTQLFTPLVLQMMEVGEETGRLDEMMQEVAEFYEREVATDVKNITQIIEPILTVVMGLMVLVLAMGVFVPMWDMIKLTQR